MYVLFRPTQSATNVLEGTPGAAGPPQDAVGTHLQVSVFLLRDKHHISCLSYSLCLIAHLTYTLKDPPPCDVTGLEDAFEDQLAEFDAVYEDGADYDEDIEDEDVDFETKGYLRG